VNPTDGTAIQTLPLEPRGCTGVSSFVWDGKQYLLICCDATHQLTLWVWAAGEFVKLGTLLDLNETTETAIRAYVNPAKTAYLVFTSFGVLLRFRFADLVKYAEDANEGKEPSKPVPFDSHRLPVLLHDAFVLPKVFSHFSLLFFSSLSFSLFSLLSLSFWVLMVVFLVFLSLSSCDSSGRWDCLRERDSRDAVPEGNRVHGR